MSALAVSASPFIGEESERETERQMKGNTRRKMRIEESEQRTRMKK